jgi:hypothetical protein
LGGAAPAAKLKSENTDKLSKKCFILDQARHSLYYTGIFRSLLSLTETQPTQMHRELGTRN